jgi:hypothetical protein
MASVILLRTNVSEEHIASIFRAKDTESPCFAARIYITRFTLLHRTPEDSVLIFTAVKTSNLNIVVFYGRLIITFNEATASQLYLHGNTKTRQWKYRCKGLSSPSVVKYTLATNQGDRLFHREDGGNMFPRNVDSYKNCTASS